MIETLTLWLVILTGCIVVLTAVYAFLTYRIARSNRQSVDVMRSGINSSVRPYVFFDLVMSGPLVEGVILNSGISAAYNLSVDLSPVLTARIRSSPQKSFLLGNSIKYLPPNREIREFYGSLSEIESDCPSLSFVGRVSYMDSEKHEYSEQFTIDLGSRKSMPYIGRTTIEEELKKLNELVSRIAKS